MDMRSHVQVVAWLHIGLVVAVFELLNVPFGTLLAIYTFWVLLNERTKPLFSPGY